MSTACPDPSMHSPGFQNAHCLPQAGLKTPINRDIYRYNRVVPLYPPDPCIRPNEGDLLCPPNCGEERRNDLLPSAGVDARDSDVFRFYATRQSAPRPQPVAACGCPVFASNAPCTSLGPITNQFQCPCINRTSVGSQDCSNAQKRRAMQYGGVMPLQPTGKQCGHNQGSNVSTGYTKGCNCNTQGMRSGAIAPTPNSMAMAGGTKNKMAVFGTADYCCQNPYYPSDYICRPVYDRKYLNDCPEQDGPPADTYTFL